MTTTLRRAATVVIFLFVAASAIVGLARFAASASAADPEENASSPDAVAHSPADSGLTIALHGKVLGAEERPIAGAHLYLSAEVWTDPVELGATGPDGSYRLAIPEKLFREYPEGTPLDRSWLIVTAAGHGAGWAELPAVKQDEGWAMKPEYAQDVQLVTDFPITGRVIDAKGNPVAGSTILVVRIFDLADPRWQPMLTAIKAGNPGSLSERQRDPNNWQTPLYPAAWRKTIPRVTTDVDGRFRLVGIGPDRAVDLAVDGPGIRIIGVSVLTRDDVAGFTRALRNKYPPTRDPDGYFYPSRKEENPGVLIFGPDATIEVDPARTVAGVVRDASNGEPISGLRLFIMPNGIDNASPDGNGRYRILRGDDEPRIWVYAQFSRSERYLSTVRPFSNAQGLGEIVADFNIKRGVAITGRVLESGTERPIVSAPRYECRSVSRPGALRAGHVFYFPLSTNIALRGTPSGLFFEHPPDVIGNYTVADIGGDGRFAMAVPPGPGVLLVRAMPGLPMESLPAFLKESQGLHKLFPYVTLTTRSKDDGAPEGDTQSLPGFTSPIELATYHAYRVIDPPADATTLTLDLYVPRAPSRLLHFVDPDGRAIRGVTVRGLLAPPRASSVILDGSDAEALALDPAKPREVIATSNDGKFTAKTLVSVDDPQLRTIRLEPAAAVKPATAPAD